MDNPFARVQTSWHARVARAAAAMGVDFGYKLYVPKRFNGTVIELHHPVTKRITKIRLGRKGWTKLMAIRKRDTAEAEKRAICSEKSDEVLAAVLQSAAVFYATEGESNA